MPTLPWTVPKSPQLPDGSVTIMASRFELRRLRAATSRQPHRQTVQRFGPGMAGSSFVTWMALATSLPIPWEEALHRLEKPDTVHGRQRATVSACAQSVSNSSYRGAFPRRRSPTPGPTGTRE